MGPGDVARDGSKSLGEPEGRRRVDPRAPTYHAQGAPTRAPCPQLSARSRGARASPCEAWVAYRPWLPFRSEEHTSELQSLMRISYAVFCLKKKTDKIRTKYHI